MLYWKYSANRIFFLNEYWILIPSAILINYSLIRFINSTKKKNEELEKLRREIERQKKLRRILYLAIGVDGLSRIVVRGGENIFVNVSAAECGIKEGIHFLDNDRLRKIIHDLYRYKRNNKVIYITASALCAIAKQYGTTFIALPFALGDFGFTNLQQTARKAGATILLGAVGPLYVLGGPVSLIAVCIAGTWGLQLAFKNLDSIPMSLISGTVSVENLKSRIPDLNDVVVLNERNKNKLVMPSNPRQEKGQCWLPDQALFNSDCQIKPSEIPDAIDLVSHNLNYDDVVNMKDITGLDTVDFSDVLEVGQPTLPEPRKGKTVNFRDKFADSGAIHETEKWEVNEFHNLPEKRYLRTRNKL